MESAEELAENRLSASRWSPSNGRQDNGSGKDPRARGDGLGEDKRPGSGRRSSASGQRSMNLGGESHYISDGAFSHQSSVSSAERQEEASQWDALQRLSTYDHLKTSVLRYIDDDGKIRTEEKDVTTLSVKDRQQIIGQILHVVEESNELFLRKLRARLNRVGINPPTIEVRYNHLSVEAQVHLGSRVTPNLLNYLTSVILWPLSLFGAVKKSRLQIISDLSGIVKPKRLTLLLGPPQSGRTTFLRALAGRLDRNLQVSGDITYNGHMMNEFVARKTSSYVSQYDVQTPELTVRESLDFYCRVQGVGNRRDMLNELLRREREAGIKPEPDTDIFLKATTLTARTDNLLTDYFMKLTGLDICADTIIGDAMHRGISGGQKKRLTTAEMLVGPAKALFMDEISTGLDSSTTFQIVLMLRHIAHLLESTIVVSLLQPPPETYQLFDDVILLAEGQIIYQGPCSAVMEFMEFMGFKCPSRKAVADFLQEVTSRKDQQQYWADTSIPYQYVSVPKFVKGFSLFHVGQNLVNEVSIPYEKSKSHPAALINRKYALNNKQIIQACFAREFILMKRHLPVYTAKVIQMGIVSAIAGTLYLRTRMPRNTINDANLYIGALFYGLILVMTAGLAELSFTLVRLPVYYKEKELSLYPAWAIVIPMFILRIPWSVMETAVYMFICYFTTGFTPEAGRFFILFMTLFLINQATVGVFRFAAAIGGTRVAAMNVGTAINVTFILLGGFVLSKDDTPVWWRWASWCSTLMYGQQAVSANELLSYQWTKPFGDSTLGKTALKLRGLESKSFIIWTSMAALLGFTIIFNICLMLTLQYRATPPVVRNIIALKRGDDEESLEEYDLASNRNPSPVRNDGLGASQSDFEPTARSSGFAKRSSSISERPSRMSSGTYARLDLFGGKRGMVLPFKPYAISFDRISYYVDMPKTMKQHGVDGDKLRLLADISGAFRPGVMTALVGVSGAGKTTLLDVLAGRKTRGYVEGEIMISGYVKQQSTFARIAGYCEQTDIHSPHITVYESIVFSAWMRLVPEVDRELRQCFVDEVIRLVELEDLRDFVVGLPGESGLTTEQRKRLTIAVELVANPSIIFMDEPTSGLDARAAAIVMRAVRNIGDTGRTIVCTIHQPSIDIFEAFDELLLLKRGGKTIYSGRLGRHSRYLIEYFEAIPGVPKIKDGYNPATWMLDVTSTSMETKLGIDFAKHYENSSAFRNNKDLVERLKIPNPESTDLTFPTKYAQSFGVQCMASFWKVGMSYWRHTSYTGVRVLYSIAFGLLIGSVFWGLGNKRERPQDIFNLMGACFTSVLFMGANGTLVVQPVITTERIVYYRERGAQMYSPMAFTWAQFFIEWPSVLLQSVLFTAITYPMMQLEWEAGKVFFFFFFLNFTLLFYIYWGMIAVAATSNLQLASILSTSFFGFFNLFAGLAITKAQIPIWWKWAYWCNPPAWTLYGLIASQLGDVDQLILIPDRPGQQVTVKQFVADYFGFEKSFLKWIVVEQVGLVLSMALFFAILMKYCNFQQR